MWSWTPVQIQPGQAGLTAKWGRESANKKILRGSIKDREMLANPPCCRWAAVTRHHLGMVADEGPNRIQMAVGVERVGGSG